MTHVTPDPSTEALRGGKFSRYFPDDRADIDVTDEVERLFAERDALAARLSQTEEAIRACIGDAEGQEAVREHKMLELTKGQVQLLAAALAASSAGETPE